MSELVESGGALTDRIGAVRAGLASAVGVEPAQVERRVAASVAHLGLVARLIASSVAVAGLLGRVPDTDLDQLWWQDELGGGFPLSAPTQLSVDAPTSRHPAALGDRLATNLVVAGPIAQLTGAVTVAVPISARVLWGNVASALNSAVGIIATQRPPLAARTSAIGEAVLSRIPYVRAGTKPGPGFRRDSCCLIYRVGSDPAMNLSTPAASVCGDCVLAGD